MQLRLLQQQIAETLWGRRAGNGGAELFDLRHRQKRLRRRGDTKKFDCNELITIVMWCSWDMWG